MSQEEKPQAQNQENADLQGEAVAPETKEEVVSEAPSGVEDEAAATDIEGEPPVEMSLEDTVTQLQEDILAARDAALRAQADVQNVKRRAEQEVERARKFALERFSGDLLPVADNLERALEAASGSDELSRSISEGMELTLKTLLDAMKKYNIDVLDPIGEPFDPQLHQAMTIVENPDVEPNTVTAVMQKGYTLNGRLIRPAMVMVSKAPG